MVSWSIRGETKSEEVNDSDEKDRLSLRVKRRSGYDPGSLIVTSIETQEIEAPDTPSSIYSMSILSSDTTIIRTKIGGFTALYDREPILDVRGNWNRVWDIALGKFLDLSLTGTYRVRAVKRQYLTIDIDSTTYDVPVIGASTLFFS